MLSYGSCIPAPAPFPALRLFFCADKQGNKRCVKLQTYIVGGRVGVQTSLSPERRLRARPFYLMGRSHTKLGTNHESNTRAHPPTKTNQTKPNQASLHNNAHPCAPCVHRHVCSRSFSPRLGARRSSSTTWVRARVRKNCVSLA